MAKLDHYNLADIGNMKILGRTTGYLSPLTLFWTGSGIELNVRASELWVEIEAGHAYHEPWVAIVINGAYISRQMVTPGRKWLCVFRKMNGGVVKNVKIIKETQPISEDAESCLQIHAVKCDGEFLPVPERPYKIEFIGDSITSGEGAIGSKQEADWIMMWFSAVRNYTYMLSKALNADYRVISQCGWGVYSGYDNNPHKNIPDYYEKVCGVIRGEKAAALGAHNPYDFSSWQPDIVIVNLGTNDEGAFNNPQWVDEVSGKVYKQRKNDDGSYNEEDLRKFENAVTSFIFKVRKYNPNTHIIWAYGMLGDGMMPSIIRAVDEYKKQAKDSKVYVQLLPDITEETVGSRFHPGARAHEQAAKTLETLCRKLLNC